MTNLQIFFDTLNSFFDKIYVITLHRANDRHEHIRKELEGLNYEFFFGKDKQDFTIDQLKQEGIYDEALARKHHRYGKPMPPGMIGASWSHAEVYKKIVQHGFKRTFIMEDDVVIDKKQISTLPAVLSELPGDWELFYFGFAEKEKTPPLAFLKKAIYHLQHFFGRLNYSHTTISNLYPKKISKHIYQAGYHDCIHAYGLSLSGAKKLLELQTPISFIPDNLLAHAATNKILNGYIILPKIINQLSQVGVSNTSYINE